MLLFFFNNIDLSSLRNGDLWYKLRSGAQKLMMRPQSASVFLDQENEVMYMYYDSVVSGRHNISLYN